MLSQDVPRCPPALIPGADGRFVSGRHPCEPAIHATAGRRDDFRHLPANPGFSVPVAPRRPRTPRRRAGRPRRAARSAGSCIVVWMSAWPIHSWTRRMSALPIIRVPNVWRRSWNRSGRRPAASAPSCSGGAAPSHPDTSRSRRRRPDPLRRVQSLALPSRASADADIRRHRHRADLAGLRCRELARGSSFLGLARRAGEVDVAPAHATSSPHAQTSERRGQEDRSVLLGLGRADERPHLLGREHVDLAAALPRELLDRGGRVHRQPVDLASPARRSRAAGSAACCGSR